MTDKIKPTKFKETVLTELQIKQLQNLLGGMAKITLSADRIILELDKIVLKLKK